MSDGLLQGGRRRRRPARVAAVVALLLAPVAVGVAVWLAFGRDGGGGAAHALPAGVPPAPARAPTDPVLPEEPSAAVRLDGVDAFSVRLRRPPRAGLVFDLDSGEVLWRRHPLRVLPIASLTKIMTALVVTERTRPRDPVRITPEALRYSGSGVGRAAEGQAGAGSRR